MLSKKASQFVSFKIGNVHFLDILNIPGGAINLDSFLKAHKTSETKGFCPYERFTHPDKLNNNELPPCEAFHNKLRNCNPLEKEYVDYEQLIGSGFTTETALVKMRLSEKPPAGAGNYSYLRKVWEQEKTQSFKDFLRWYNNKDVVPTLEAVQKMVGFYHNKRIDMLKLGFTSLDLANICLHSSASAKFYPFGESDKDLHSKVREDMVGGPSIVFTREAVVEETNIR